MLGTDTTLSIQYAAVIVSDPMQSLATNNLKEQLPTGTVLLTIISITRLTGASLEIN